MGPADLASLFRAERDWIMGGWIIDPVDWDTGAHYLIFTDTDCGEGRSRLGVHRSF